MNNINGGGIVAGIITWLCIMWYATTQSYCLRTDTCGSGDMFLFAIIGVGMLVPAWLVAMLVSPLFESE